VRTNGAILFSVVFTPSPPSHGHHGSVWLLYVISLLLTNTVSPVRACLIIWWERFRGTQKEDDRWPLSIQSYRKGDKEGTVYIIRIRSEEKRPEDEKGKNKNDKKNMG
jgi:hypothetical protein